MVSALLKWLRGTLDVKSYLIGAEGCRLDAGSGVVRLYMFSGEGSRSTSLFFS